MENFDKSQGCTAINLSRQNVYPIILILITVLLSVTRPKALVWKKKSKNKSPDFPDCVVVEYGSRAVQSLSVSKPFSSFKTAEGLRASIQPH
jgi:hypothetical protein